MKNQLLVNIVIVSFALIIGIGIGIGINIAEETVESHTKRLHYTMNMLVNAQLHGMDLGLKYCNGEVSNRQFMDTTIALYNEHVKHYSYICLTSDLCEYKGCRSAPQFGKCIIIIPNDAAGLKDCMHVYHKIKLINGLFIGTRDSLRQESN